MSKPLQSTRRRFLSLAALSAVPVLGRKARAKNAAKAPEIWIPGATRPCAIASGNGDRAVERAFSLMQKGARPVDAAVAGVNIIENDPKDYTVGYGGLPNADGVVELDSCCMDGPTHLAGAVASLRNIKNPSQVALLVMRRTDHVLLVGEGALRFAKSHGFKETNLLTDYARKRWLEWRETLSTKDDWVAPGENELPKKQRKGVPPEDSDKEAPLAKGPLDEGEARPTGTIHLSAINADGDLGACTTTSGLFFKIPGRVGDSPLIGCGLYTDNAFGSAGSTGRGEAAILSNGAHTAVEMLRQGKSPVDACVAVVKRIVEQTKIARLLNDRGVPNFGVNFYAVNKKGEYGAASMYPSHYSVCTENGLEKKPTAHLYERR